MAQQHSGLRNSVSANQLRVWTAMFIREAEARGPLEILAHFIEPALMVMAICTLSWLIERVPPFGDNMILWAVSGVAPMFLFIHMSMHTERTVEPKMPFSNDFDAIFIKALISFINITFASILLLYVLYKTQTHRAMPVYPVSAAVIWVSVAVFAFGLAMINRMIGTVAPVWSSIYSVFSRIMVHVSGVYFVVDNLPLGVRSWLAWNPLVGLVIMLRWSFYGYFPHAILSISYTVAWVCGSFVLGMVLQICVRNKIVET